jgi:hypothetical protein
MPVYSRCFSDLCKITMSDDVLLSGFLAALYHSTLPEEDRELEFEDEKILIEYSESGELKSVKFHDMDLLFYLIEVNDLIIAAGFPKDQNRDENHQRIVQLFFKSLQTKLIDNNVGKSMHYDSKELELLEKLILIDVIKPWMKDHNVKDKCALKGNCPFRVALYEEENKQKSIFDSLKYTVRRYGKMSMLKKMILVFKQPKLSF